MCKNDIKENPLPQFFLISSSFLPQFFLISTKLQLKGTDEVVDSARLSMIRITPTVFIFKFSASVWCSRKSEAVVSFICHQAACLASPPSAPSQTRHVQSSFTVHSTDSHFVEKLLSKLWENMHVARRLANTRCVNGRQTYPPSISTVNEREMDLTEMCSLLRNKKLQQTSITIRRHRTNQIMK